MLYLCLTTVCYSVQPTSVLKRGLGTSSFNDVFLKISKYDRTSKFQKVEIGFDQTFMQNKIDICKTDFSQEKVILNLF